MRPGPEHGGGPPDLAILPDAAAGGRRFEYSTLPPRQPGDPSAAALGPEDEVHMDVAGSPVNIHSGPARSIVLDPDDDAIMDVT